VQINNLLDAVVAATYKYFLRAHVLQTIDHGERPENTGQPDDQLKLPETSGGQPVSRIQASQKAVATRQGRYGETKLKPDTQKSMEDRGDDVRDNKFEKSLGNPRAN
jgi:hypothetical protein